jgi:hypothetical protein
MCRPCPRSGRTGSAVPDLGTAGALWTIAPPPSAGCAQLAALALLPAVDEEELSFDADDEEELEELSFDDDDDELEELSDFEEPARLSVR